MDTQLLTTKLYIPPVRPNLVPRPHLLQRLDEGLRLGHRLTLVSAPAGFGKTTLLSEMHLVIATRADPPLPLPLLRIRGELIELRAADLRFASGEVAAFFNEVMGLALSTEDIAALETRTEGWAAGLQVVALSLQGRGETSHFIRAFTGSNRYILDYLTEEVLQRQPEDVQSFLLRTAVLDRLTGPLCDALTGQGEARSC